MPKQWKAWTMKEIQRLIQLREEGKDYHEIALSLGRSEASVRGQILYYGVPKRKRFEKYLQLFSVPHVLEEIAQKMGVCKLTVIQAKCYVKRMGFRVAEAIIDRSKGGDPMYFKKPSRGSN